MVQPDRYLPAPPKLFLDTGMLDESRRVLRPGEREYDLFLWALQWQDTWTHEKHRGFWLASLRLWPPAGGKPPLDGAFAWCIAHAVEELANWRRAQDGPEVRAKTLAEVWKEWEATARSDLDDFLSRFGTALGDDTRKRPVPGLRRQALTLAECQSRGYVAAAVAMLHAPRHRHREGGRLPRVATKKHASPPVALQFSDLDEAGYATARDGSYVVRKVAAGTVKRMIED